jgi:hypothetical protein
MTKDPGPPYCAKVTFWQTEQDACKAAVAEILDWVSAPKMGRADMHLFLQLVQAEDWAGALAEGTERMKQLRGSKPYVSVMQIAPQKYEDASVLKVQAGIILRGK